MSIIISFGRYAGFRIRPGSVPVKGIPTKYLRILLGWVSVIIIMTDVDYLWTDGARK